MLHSSFCVVDPGPIDPATATSKSCETTMSYGGMDTAMNKNNDDGSDDDFVVDAEARERAAVRAAVVAAVVPDIDYQGTSSRSLSEEFFNASFRSRNDNDVYDEDLHASSMSMGDAANASGLASILNGSSANGFHGSNQISISDSIADVAALACDEEEMLSAKRSDRAERLRLREQQGRQGDEVQLDKLEQSSPGMVDLKMNEKLEAKAAAAGGDRPAGVMLKKYQPKQSRGDGTNDASNHEHDTLEAGASPTELREHPNQPPGAVRVTGLHSEQTGLSTGSLLIGDSTPELPLEPTVPSSAPPENLTAEYVTEEQIRADALERMLRTSVLAEVVRVVPDEPEHVDEFDADDSKTPGGQSKRQSTRYMVTMVVGIILVLAVIVGGVVAGISMGGGGGGNGSGTGTDPDITTEPGTVLSAEPSLATSATPSSAPTQGILSQIYSRVALYPEIPFPGPGSPQHFALEHLYERDSFFANYTLRQLRQRYAMMTILGGLESIRNIPLAVLQIFGWFTDSNECTWLGVTCNEQGDLTSMEVSLVTQLTGTIPAEVGLLSTLGESILTDRIVVQPTKDTEARCLLTRIHTFFLSLSLLFGCSNQCAYSFEPIEKIITRELGLGGEIPTEYGLLTRLSK